MNRLSICFISSLFLLSCGEDRTHEYNEKTECDHAIQQLVQDNYLWGESVNDVDWKNYFEAPSDFLKRLTAQAPVTDKWSYCSTDTVEVDYNEIGLFNHLDSYGLDVSLILDPTSETTNQFARVLTVYPNSPAANVGITRGAFISAINGEKVTSKNINSLKKGRVRPLTVLQLDVDEQTGNISWCDTMQVSIEASRKVYVDQVWTSGMITDNCAYVLLTNLCDGKSVNIIKQLLANNPERLVVDLRLCNQGTIDEAFELASLLAGKGGAFLNTLYRDSQSYRNRTYTVASATCNTNVFFITSSYTKGAAEWLIHGLRCLNGEKVTVVGQTTAGQNLYLESVPTSYYHTLHLATAYVADGEGNYDYASGIVPDIEINEFKSVKLFPYGTTDETILNLIINN